MYNKFSLGKHLRKKSSTKRSSKKRSSKKRSSKKRSNRGVVKLNAMLLPKGTILYHGQQDGKDWKVPTDRPAFFGGLNVSTHYAQSSKYVFRFETQRDMILLNLESENDYKNVYNSLGKRDQKVFSHVSGYNKTFIDHEDCYYSGKSKTKIKYCTEGFYTRNDEKTDNYAMLKYIKILCKLGYDGIYIPPIYSRAYKGNKLVEQIDLCSVKSGDLKKLK
jgi:hypothetical protein